MGKEKDSSGLIFGIIIGAIIALILFRRDDQQILSQHALVRQEKQSQQLTWKPIDIPRVDDIKPQTIQQPIIQIQQDSQLIKTLSELQKTNSRLEQTTSKLQELQETVSKLKDSQPQQIIIQQPMIQPSIQPAIQPINIQEPINIQKPTDIQKSINIQKPTDIQEPINIQKPTDIQEPINIQEPLKQEQQIYKNSEKWQIIRGKDGRIKSLDIVRDVKKSN